MKNILLIVFFISSLPVYVKAQNPTDSSSRGKRLSAFDSYPFGPIVLGEMVPESEAVESDAAYPYGPVVLGGVQALQQLRVETPYNEESGSNVGFTIGVIGNIRTPIRHLDAAYGLSVSTVGGKVFDNEVKLNTIFLKVPLLATTQFGNFKFGLGPQIGFGVGGSYKDGDHKEKAFSNEAGALQLKRLSLEILGGFWTNIIHPDIIAGLTYSRGLNNLAKEDGVKIRHSELAIVVGYSIKSLVRKDAKGLAIAAPPPAIPAICECDAIAFNMNKPKTHMAARVREQVVKGVGALAGTSHYKVTFDVDASITCSKGAGAKCSGAVYVTARLGANNAGRKFAMEAPCNASMAFPISWTILSPSAPPAELAKKKFTLSYTIEVVCGGSMRRQEYTADISGLGLTDPKWGPWTDVPDEESRRIQKEFKDSSIPK